MHIYFDDSDFLMGIILKLELMDVHTRPESVCFVSNVSTFIKNQKNGGTLLSVCTWLFPHVALKIQ